MKYIVVCADGMADWPLDQFNNKTPMELAHKPNMDALAKKSFIGTVKTIPDGMLPGSDTANMSVLGYDPRMYYTGRSPFEAISMGIEMDLSDMSFRCNLVTLSEGDSFANRTMLDHGADDISTAEAAILINVLQETFAQPDFDFFAGVSYRNLLLWRNCDGVFNLTPPHDILGEEIGRHLPSGDNYRNQTLLSLMEKSADILGKHYINIERVTRGLNPANAIWFWGEGRKPKLMNFYRKYALKGSVISAVDLIKGIGICAGLESIDVPGANATINTNYTGKAEAAIESLKRGDDFIYVHIEAPDECGHKGNVNEKIKAIELIDKNVIGHILNKLSELDDDFRLMILPDHPTPLAIRTHVCDPVPYLIYDSRDSNVKNADVNQFSEKIADKNGPYIPEGFRLMDIFLEREGCCGEHKEEA